MTLGDLPEIPTDVFREAVRGFWDARVRQSQQQQLAGKVDQGNRGAVTGGKQMDGFALVLTNLLIEAGVPSKHIHVARSLTVIPGFFRPTKTYDLLVVDPLQRQLKVAIELKSQLGSLGNNFNNRVEEAMGAALDIWTTYREGGFGSAPTPPWVGYLFVLEDSLRSNLPVRATSPHFPVLPEFQGASYARRYEMFCQKMVRERHYNAACFILAAPDQSPAYSEPAPELSAAKFLFELLRHAL